MSVIPSSSRTVRQLRPGRRPSAWEALINRDTAPLWIRTARSGRELFGSSSESVASNAASRYQSALRAGCERSRRPA